jgi:hypothetical protein
MVTREPRWKRERHVLRKHDLAFVDSSDLISPLRHVLSSSLATKLKAGIEISIVASFNLLTRAAVDIVRSHRRLQHHGQQISRLPRRASGPQRKGLRVARCTQADVRAILHSPFDPSSSGTGPCATELTCSKHIQFQPLTPKQIVRISEVEVATAELYQHNDNGPRTTVTNGPLDARMVSVITLNWTSIAHPRGRTRRARRA